MNISSPQATIPTSARWLTAIAITGLVFIVLFLVFFIVTLLGCAAVVGGQAAVAQHAQGYEAGHQVGEAAGRAFGKTYGGLIALLSAGAALVLSMLVSWRIAFSNLLPWCRPS